ncbi:MAG: LLM class flavin-dependent oxidoreductase [Myxococcales bacterium]|nr:LLM class flavin-dependent oxidoreductase [Myxococcales bacterium]
MIPLSVLDLSPIREGGDAAQAFRDTLDLARHAERWGYRRYWLAEHHGMPGIASSATAVLINHVAAGTATIRVGSGGIMLPNHSPLVVAEQFGTLESLHPGRIDLGLGRAPGSDQITARAIRRHNLDAAEVFPQDVAALLDYFSDDPRQPVLAVPGRGLAVPIWILGSSLFSAELAAGLGLPYAFASHFAPGDTMAAVRLYRQRFVGSQRLARPHVMLGFNVFAAETDAEAELLATSIMRSVIDLRTGRPGRLQPPDPGLPARLGPAERALVEHFLTYSAIGSPATVRRQLHEFITRTGADELMISAHIFDHAARLRSYEITADIGRSLAAESPAR